MSLAACPACARHVRRSERACPFCASPLSLPPAPPRVVLPRLGRTASFAFGAALSTTAAACSPTAPADAGTDVGMDDVGYNDVAVYGGPDAGEPDAPPADAPSDVPSDAAVDAPTNDAATNTDAGEDAGGIIPAYGAPP
jgi:hypothetical protein